MFGVRWRRLGLSLMCCLNLRGVILVILMGCFMVMILNRVLFLVVVLFIW